MITKAEIKLIRSLSQKKFRDASGFFVVEGEKLVSEALASGFDVQKIFRTEDIGAENMSKITHLSSPSPVLALVRKPVAPAQEDLPVAGVSLALDSIRDPGNLGTIIRLADWFGIERIYASHDTVDMYNPKVLQASMGAIFRKQIIYTDLKMTVSGYLKAGIPVYGTFLDGRNIYGEVLSKDNALVIMGSENNGISAELESMVSDKLLIPPYPENARTSESLNVAIATAIICAEFRRPR